MKVGVWTVIVGVGVRVRVELTEGVMVTVLLGVGVRVELTV